MESCPGHCQTPDNDGSCKVRAVGLPLLHRAPPSNTDTLWCIFFSRESLPYRRSWNNRGVACCRRQKRSPLPSPSFFHHIQVSFKKLTGNNTLFTEASRLVLGPPSHLSPWIFHTRGSSSTSCVSRTSQSSNKFQPQVSRRSLPVLQLGCSPRPVLGR